MDGSNRRPRLEEGGRTLALLVEVAGRRVAVPAAAVQSVQRAVATVAAGAASFVDVHGEAVKVLDLRGALGLPVKEVEPSDQLVLIQLEGLRGALLVDRSLDLVSLEGSLEGEARSHEGTLLLIPDLGALLRGGRADAEARRA